jgi:hypothetical protein
MKALVRVTAWERMSLWRRLLGASIRVAILAVFVTVALVFLAPPITILFLRRTFANSRAGMKVVPTVLSDLSVSDSPGKTLTYFGYEFTVPWNANFKERVGKSGQLVQLKFDSGQDIMFLAHSNSVGLLTGLADDDAALKMGDLRPVFADLMKRSAYDQYLTVLNMTPQMLRPFGPKDEAARRIVLLLIKGGAFGPGLDSGAYTFELPDKRGFQIGNPQSSGRVDLEVFDSSGHQLEFVCGSTNANFRYAQPELNRILTSLHATKPLSRSATPEK